LGDFPGCTRRVRFGASLSAVAIAIFAALRLEFRSRSVGKWISPMPEGRCQYGHGWQSKHARPALGLVRLAGDADEADIR